VGVNVQIIGVGVSVGTATVIVGLITEVLVGL